MNNDLHISNIFSNFAAQFHGMRQRRLGDKAMRLKAMRREVKGERLKVKGKDMRIGGKIIAIVSVLAVVALAVLVYVKFFFVYSQGVNEGDINYFQNEGFIFKTYEGKMIQTGYNSHNMNSTIQSNEFKFSVEDERVARQIETNSSRQIKLHWKRYLGVLPWRGNSQYVVDSIVSVRPGEAK